MSAAAALLAETAHAGAHPPWPDEGAELLVEAEGPAAAQGECAEAAAVAACGKAKLPAVSILVVLSPVGKPIPGSKKEYMRARPTPSLLAPWPRRYAASSDVQPSAHRA